LSAKEKVRVHQRGRRVPRRQDGGVTRRTGRIADNASRGGNELPVVYTRRREFDRAERLRSTGLK